MTRSAIALLGVVTIAFPTIVSAGETVEYFVATNGDDQNPGTSDRPFATLTKARDAVRMARKSAAIASDVTIWMRGGRYELLAPLNLEEHDSAATNDVATVYSAAPGESVRITGTRRVRGFQPVVDSNVLDRLDPQARANVLVADLRANGVEDLGEVASRGRRIEVFYRGKPMQLARWPNQGFSKIVDVVGDTPIKIHGIPGTKEGQFTYEGDRPARWKAESDKWLHGYWFWDWSDSFERIETIDVAAKTIHLAPSRNRYGYRKNQRYYALNLLCELDEPGEWYVDRKAGLLYFWPPGPVGAGDVAVSVLPQLLQLQNCSGVVFRDLEFDGTRATAISLRDARRCSIESCTIRNTGGWGIQVTGGAECTVRDCRLYDLGEGGVSLSGGDRNALTPAGHECINNHIHHFGRLYRTYRPAVGLGGVGNRVLHNLIHDGPHNAIQLGGNDHLIEFNEIHTVCFETGDVGAFYTGRDWTQRGTVIRHNYFHDIQGPGLHGAMAVYLDDAASGFQIIGNIFLRAGRAAFIGGGRDNLVENNIFVDCQPSVHVDARGVGWMRNHIEEIMPQRLNAMPYRESPWKDRYPQLLTLLEDEPGRPKHNIVRHNISWGGKWLNADAKAKPLIQFDANLIDQDPRFVGDVRADHATVLDFRLKPDSPALELGFKPIPVEKIGRLK